VAFGFGHYTSKVILSSIFKLDFRMGILYRDGGKANV
jgi:hypothetical protein